MWVWANNANSSRRAHLISDLQMERCKRKCDVIPRPKFLPSKINGTQHKGGFTPNQDFPFSLRLSVILLQQICPVPVVELPQSVAEAAHHMSRQFDTNTTQQTTQLTSDSYTLGPVMFTT